MKVILLIDSERGRLADLGYKPEDRGSLFLVDSYIVTHLQNV
jgi:hypothetical protein